MFIVDLSDGKLFRFRKSGKTYLKPLFPKYLDRMGHFVNNPFLFLCLGFGLLHHSQTIFYFSLVAAFFYLLNKALALNPSWYKSQEEREMISLLGKFSSIRDGKSLIKKLIFDFIRIEHMGNLLFLLILFNLAHYAIMAYAIIHSLEFLRKLISQGVILFEEDKKRG